MRSDVAGRALQRRKSTTIKINYININVPPAINVSVGRWTAAELKVIWDTHTHRNTFTHRNPQPTTQVDNNEYLIKWPERYLAPFKFRERKAPKMGKKRERRQGSGQSLPLFCALILLAIEVVTVVVLPLLVVVAQNFISIINTNVVRALASCSNLSCEFQLSSDFCCRGPRSFN